MLLPKTLHSKLPKSLHFKLPLTDVEPGHSYFAKEMSLNYTVSKGKIVRVFTMQDDYEVNPLEMLFRFPLL